MVSDKDKCFRLRGIPSNFGETEIQDILVQEFSLHENVEIEVHSLSCNPVREEESIATLGFSAIPASLARQPDYFIDIPRSRRQLHLDAHFEGFTPLHTTSDDKCTIDVVAISGLNGHAFGSFKQVGRRRMWLRDDLPLDFKQARIFIYGYDTSPEHHAFQNILDIADTFRKNLATLRQAHRQRPLIFIAHSLGGIIVKAALNSMDESHDGQDKRNLSTLQGLFFFGVPNQGMNVESLIAMNPDITNRRIIYALDSQNSAELRTISENFNRIFKNTVTVNFYETLKSPTAQRQADGSWSMSGPHEILVSIDSATQGQPYDVGVQYVFQTQQTHSSMVKLNGVHDPTYEHVRYRLMGIVQEVGKRGADFASQLTQEEKDCLQSLWFRELNDRQLQATDPALGTCSWIFENPNFKKWNESPSNLLWILGPPGSGKSTLMKYMVQWKINQRKDEEVIAAFFIHGQGKSEMQYSPLGLYRALLHQILPQFPKHLTDLAQKYKSYQDSRGNHGVTWTWSEQELRDCFFNILTKETPKHPVTVLVDALDEISSSRADVNTLGKELIAALKKLTDGHIPNHTGRELKVLVSCRYYPMIYDNSGLSILIEKENDKDITTLIENHRLMNNIRGEEQSLKRIIQNRANGVFQWVAVVLEEVDRLHSRGMSFTTIKKAVETVPVELQDLYESLVLSGDSDERKLALKLFTWRIFAVQPLSLAEFRDSLAVDATMEYNSFAELSECKEFRNLNAMEKVVNDVSRGLIQVQRNQYLTGPRFYSTWFPNDETRQFDPNYNGELTLQFIHQSVLDYLKAEGLHKLAASIGKPNFNAQWELSRSCIKYLLLEEIINTPFERKGSHQSDEDFKKNIIVPLTFGFALTDYAHSFWLLHVMKAEEENVDQQDLLRLSALKGQKGYLPGSCNLRLTDMKWDSTLMQYRTRVRQVDNMLQFWDSRGFRLGDQFRCALLKHPYKLALVELLSLGGLKAAVLRMQQMRPGSSKWKRTTVLLQYALLGRHQDTIDWILNNLEKHHLQRLLNIDTESSLYLPLTIAVAQGDPKLVQRLLDEGANVNAKNRSSLWCEPCTALGMAAEQGNTTMVKILLNAKADPMQKTRVAGLYNGLEISTPHFAAAVQGHDDVVELLLKQSCENGSAQRIASMSTFYGGFTLLHLCHSGTVIKTLLDHGADPNAQDREGRTPLHKQCGYSSLVRLLLDHGSDPTKRDEIGMTPLECTVDGSETHDLMFNWTDSCGRTAPMLHVITCREAEEHEMHMLRSQPALKSTIELIRSALDRSDSNFDHDWNQQDQDGCTLLTVAVQQNIPDIVGMLLDSGKVNPRTADKQGITPLQRSRRYGYDEITNLLQRYQEIDSESISREEHASPVSDGERPRKKPRMSRRIQGLSPENN